MKTHIFPLLVALLASSSFAQQRTCLTAESPFEPTNFTGSLNVPRFDPALGELVRVDLQVSADVRGAARVESLDAGPTQVVTHVAADVTVVQGAMSLVVLMLPVADFHDSFSAYDGELDFAGSSGATHDGIEVGDQFLLSIDATDTKFAQFIGTSPISFAATAMGSSTATGSGNFSTRFETAARVRIQVCYTFVGGTPPTVDCPGPLNASVGVPLQFQVCATDPDAGDEVTLNGVMPMGAVANPPFPVVGNPACTTITWTPQSNQLGQSNFVFTADDAASVPATCTTVVTTAECHMVFGLGGGTSSTTIFGHLYDTQLARVRLSFPVTMASHPSFLLRMVPPVVSVQVLMYNPQIFPGNPSQWSRTLTVVRGPNQTLTSSYSGTENGITIQAETFQQGGLTRVRFPFLIPGL